MKRRAYSWPGSAVTGPCMLMLAAVAWTLPGTATFAQAENADLRRENARLHAQVEELEAEVRAARQRIEQLERELDAARRMDPPPDLTVEPDPDAEPVADPMRSPYGLFRMLQESYLESLGDRFVGEPESSEREAYLQAIEAWRKRAERRMRGTARWHMRVVETELRNRTLEVRFQPIDPDTREAVGTSFTHRLSQLEKRRFQRLLDESGDRVLLIAGSLTPRITINEARRDPGPFNRPPLLGPFAEFGYEFEIRSFHHPDDEPAEEHATDQDES